MRGRSGTITDMHDLSLLLILVVMILSFISTLLYISLRARHVAVGSVVRVLLELWGAFALIIGIFAYIGKYLGSTPALRQADEFAAHLPVPPPWYHPQNVHSGSFASELANRLAHWHTLSATQHVSICLGTLLAVGLFVHVLISVQALQSRRIVAAFSHEGDMV